LGSGAVGAAPADIAFALRMQAGVAEVRESGTYKSEIAFGAGDTFSIIVSNGSVSYAKNGGVFYVSSTAMAFAAYAQAIFFDMNATIRDVTIGSVAAASTSGAAPAPPSTGTATAGVSPQYARPAASMLARKKM
jgi:hypothetical protein